MGAANWSRRRRQMTTLPYYNNFFKTSNRPVTALSAKLAELTPDGLNNVFYANSEFRGE